MKCFVALDEATILRLWLQDPQLVAPFARPFCPSAQLAVTMHDHPVPAVDEAKGDCLPVPPAPSA